MDPTTPQQPQPIDIGEVIRTWERFDQIEQDPQYRSRDTEGREEILDNWAAAANLVAPHLPDYDPVTWAKDLDGYVSTKRQQIRASKSWGESAKEGLSQLGQMAVAAVSATGIAIADTAFSAGGKIAAVGNAAIQSKGNPVNFASRVIAEEVSPQAGGIKDLRNTVVRGVTKQEAPADEKLTPWASLKTFANGLQKLNQAVNVELLTPEAQAELDALYEREALKPLSGPDSRGGRSAEDLVQMRRAEMLADGSPFRRDAAMGAAEKELKRFIADPANIALPPEQWEAGIQERQEKLVAEAQRFWGNEGVPVQKVDDWGQVYTPPDFSKGVDGTPFADQPGRSVLGDATNEKMLKRFLMTRNPMYLDVMTHRLRRSGQDVRTDQVSAELNQGLTELEQTMLLFSGDPVEAALGRIELGTGVGLLAEGRKIRQLSKAGRTGAALAAAGEAALKAGSNLAWEGAQEQISQFVEDPTSTQAQLDEAGRGGVAMAAGMMGVGTAIGGLVSRFDPANRPLPTERAPGAVEDAPLDATGNPVAPPEAVGLARQVKQGLGEEQGLPGHALLGEGRHRELADLDVENFQTAWKQGGLSEEEKRGLKRVLILPKGARISSVHAALKREQEALSQRSVPAPVAEADAPTTSADRGPDPMSAPSRPGPGTVSSTATRVSTVGGRLREIADSQDEYAPVADELYNLFDDDTRNKQHSVDDAELDRLGGARVRGAYLGAENRVVERSGSSASVAIHEAIHAKIDPLLPRLASTGRQYLADLRAWGAAPEQAGTALGELVDVYAQAVEILAPETIEALNTPEARSKGGFNYRIHEYLPEVMSNPALARRLNEVPAQGKSISVLRALVDALRKVLGLSPKAGSLLERSLMVGEAVMAMPSPAANQQAAADSSLSNQRDEGNLSPDEQAVVAQGLRQLSLQEGAEFRVSEANQNYAGHRREAERVRRVTGQTIVYIDAPRTVKFDAAHLPGTNIVFVNAAHPAEWVASLAGHEWSHWLEDADPALFRKLHDHIVQSYGPANLAAAEAQQAAVGYTPSKRRLEVVADAVGDAVALNLGRSELFELALDPAAFEQLRRMVPGWNLDLDSLSVDSGAADDASFRPWQGATQRPNWLKDRIRSTSAPRPSADSGPGSPRSTKLPASPSGRTGKPSLDGGFLSGLPTSIGSFLALTSRWSSELSVGLDAWIQGVSQEVAAAALDLRAQPRNREQAAEIITDLDRVWDLAQHRAEREALEMAANAAMVEAHRLPAGAQMADLSRHFDDRAAATSDYGAHRVASIDMALETLAQTVPSSALGRKLQIDYVEGSGAAAVTARDLAIDPDKVVVKVRRDTLPHEIMGAAVHVLTADRRQRIADGIRATIAESEVIGLVMIDGDGQAVHVPTEQLGDSKAFNQWPTATGDAELLLRSPDGAIIELPLADKKIARRIALGEQLEMSEALLRPALESEFAHFYGAGVRQHLDRPRIHAAISESLTPSLQEQMRAVLRLTEDVLEGDDWLEQREKWDEAAMPDEPAVETPDVEPAAQPPKPKRQKDQTPVPQATRQEAVKILGTNAPRTMADLRRQLQLVVRRFFDVTGSGLEALPAIPATRTVQDMIQVSINVLRDRPWVAKIRAALDIISEQEMRGTYADHQGLEKQLLRDASASYIRRLVEADDRYMSGLHALRTAMQRIENLEAAVESHYESMRALVATDQADAYTNLSRAIRVTAARLAGRSTLAAARRALDQVAATVVPQVQDGADRLRRRTKAPTGMVDPVTGLFNPSTVILYYRAPKLAEEVTTFSSTLDQAAATLEEHSGRVQGVASALVKWIADSTSEDLNRIADAGQDVRGGQDVIVHNINPAGFGPQAIEATAEAQMGSFPLMRAVADRSATLLAAEQGPAGVTIHIKAAEQAQRALAAGDVAKATEILRAAWAQRTKATHTEVAQRAREEVLRIDKAAAEERSAWQLYHQDTADRLTQAEMSYRYRRLRDAYVRTEALRTGRPMDEAKAGKRLSGLRADAIAALRRKESALLKAGATEVPDVQHRSMGRVPDLTRVRQEIQRLEAEQTAYESSVGGQVQMMAEAADVAQSMLPPPSAFDPDSLSITPEDPGRSGQMVRPVRSVGPAQLPNFVYEGSTKTLSADQVGAGLSSALGEAYGIRGSRRGPEISGGTQEDAGALRQWAEDNGRILSRNAWEAWWRARRAAGHELAIGETSEHNVMYDRATGRVVKITRIDELSDEFDGEFGHAGRASEYLSQLQAANIALEDDIIFHGLVPAESGDGFQIVTSQPYRQRSAPTSAELVARALRDAGFEYLDQPAGGNERGQWIHQRSNVRLWDHAEANFVLTQQGLIPIDVHVAPLDASQPIRSVFSDSQRDAPRDSLSIASAKLTDAQVTGIYLAVDDWFRHGGSIRGDKAAADEARRMFAQAPDDLVVQMLGLDDGRVLSAADANATAREMTPVIQEVIDAWVDARKSGANFNTVVATYQEQHLIRDRINALGARAVRQAAANQRPISMAQIRDHLIRALEIPLRFGIARRGHKNALGIMVAGPDIIRLRHTQDIETLAHEIGHWIHFVTLGRRTDAQGRPIATDFARRFDAELLALGQATSLPGYTETQIRQEGVAEFLRYFLADPAQASVVAPEFARYLIQHLETHDPAVLQSLREAQEMVTAYVEQPETLRLRAQIDFNDTAVRPGNWRDRVEALRNWWRRQYTQLFNGLYPIERVARQLEQMGMAPDQARRFADLAINYQGGAASKSEADIQFAQRNLDGRIVGRSLRDILGGLTRQEQEELSEYMVRKRADELEGRGVRTGVPPVSPAQMQQWSAQYEQRRQQLLNYQANTLQLLVDSGLISQAAHARMQQMNRDYVPFYRMYESIAGVKLGGPANGAGFVNLQSGVRTMRGSDRIIIDPLESIIKNTYLFRALAERNRVGATFVESVESMRGHGVIMDHIATPMRPVSVSHQEMVQQLLDQGVIADAAEVDGLDLTFNVWRAIHGANAAQGEFLVWRNGQQHRYQVHDELLYNALTFADQATGAFAKALGPLFPLLRGAAQTLRLGATYTPGFTLANWARDQLTAGLQSKSGYVPFVDGIRGAFHVATRSREYQEWVAMGGKFAGVVTSNRDSLRGVMEELRGPDRAVGLALLDPRNIVRSYARMMDAINEVSEEGTRVGEYLKGRGQGLSGMQAANRAKDVTLNFSRGGSVSRVLNTMIPFFNVSMQDFDLVVRTLANPTLAQTPEGRRQIASAYFRGAMLVTVPSVLVWAMGKDDDEINSLPEWRRDYYWNINLRQFLQHRFPGEPNYIVSFPKPFLLGALFGTLFERGLDQWHGNDPKGVQRGLQNLQSYTLFHGDIVQLPALVGPMMELASNYSFFTKSAITPARLQSLPVNMQFTNQTSEFAKGGSNLLTQHGINLSPIQIDHLIRGHFASLGSMSVDAIDAVMHMTGHVDKPTAAGQVVQQLTGVSRFHPKGLENTKFVDLMYSGIKEAETILAPMTESKLAELPSSYIQAHQARHGKEIAKLRSVVDPRTGRTLMGELRVKAKRFSELTKAMRMAEAEASRPWKERQATIAALHLERNQLAKQTFDLLPDSIQAKVQ